MSESIGRNYLPKGFSLFSVSQYAIEKTAYS